MDRVSGARKISGQCHCVTTPSVHCRSTRGRNPMGHRSCTRHGRPTRAAFDHRGKRATRTCTGHSTFAPELGAPLPHLHRDWAHPCHSCTGTGLAAAYLPGLGYSRHMQLHQPLPAGCRTAHDAALSAATSRTTHARTHAHAYAYAHTQNRARAQHVRAQRALRKRRSGQPTLRCAVGAAQCQRIGH